MQFSRLRLVGFKSFADATELVIKPGLTGLVGPNGCGKSNLAEALRWVMGESSYKAMRAARGEEVIFAGTAGHGGAGGRVAANFAEVALYLDNSDFKAPRGFNNEAELVIARHITRDGLSQYRINGREARAKDVQFLLADQSTGAHSPAQVGQGRVGALIEAKPQARRILLEEAAGIGGLQLRREAAEQRLARTDANLVRVSEILAVLEERLSALAAQAAEAEKFRAFSGAVRRLEAMHFRLGLREADKARRAAEAALNKQTALLAEKHEQYLKLSRKAEDLAAAAAAAEKQWAEAAAAKQRLALEYKTEENGRQLRIARSRALAENLQQLAAGAERERQRQAENDEIKEKLAAELRGLEAEALPETDKAAQQALAAARRQAEAAEQKFAAARRKRAQEEAAREARDKAAHLYAELKERQSCRRQQAEAEAHAAEKSCAAQAAACAAAAEKLAKARAAYAERERRGAALAARRDALKQDKAVIAAEAEKARLAFAAAQAEVQALRQIAAEFAGEKPDSSGSGGGDAAGAAIIKLAEVEPGYETAFAAAMGEALRGSLNAADPLYWRALPPAAASPLPAGADCLAKFARAPQALSRALAQIGLCAPQRGAEMQTQLCPGQILVSLAGDVWRWDGFSKRAGGGADIYAGYLQRKRQLHRQSRELAEKERAHKAAAARLKQAGTAFSAAEQHAQAAQQELSAARRGLNEAEAALSRAEAAKEAGAAAHQRARQELSAAQAECAALERGDGSGADAAEKDGAAAQIAAPEQQEAAAEAAYKKARDVWLVRQAEMQAKENMIAARTARLEALRRERMAWREREETQRRYLAGLSARREAAEEERRAVCRAAEEAAVRCEKLLEACAAAEAAERDLSKNAASAAAAQKNAAGAAHKAEQELASAREARSRAEEKFAAARERFCAAAAAAQAHQARSLDAEDKLAPQDEAELDTASRQEIERELRQNRARREALGAVNLRAGEESAALRARYDGLKAEAADIAAAQEKLRRAIADLNREGRARLRRAFAEVNERFAHLFQRLFGGGKAELQWLEDEDPLNIGLEIFVCPPGKKQQNISLLSGGEQSLTALALIFAVFLSNPAPLCLLDEVDAPLDDYNVERFCRLLREMTAQTQTRFLVISHNPISMAHMDRLFGVTMIEKGVSALVSVDLNEAAAMAERA